MKNTLRKILCAALALVMVFGSIPAFAAEIGDRIEWVDTGYIDGPVSVFYEHAGKATTGKSTISAKNGHFRQYYELEIEKEGYYSLTQSGLEAIDFIFGEVASDGKVYDCFDCEYFSFDDNFSELWYLPEGDIIMGVIFWEGGSNEINLEFMGEEIADIKYDENNFKNLLENEDIGIGETENGYSFSVETDYTVVFPDGREMLSEYGRLRCKIPGNTPYGTHTAKIDFMGYETEQEVSVYRIEDLVESIELENLEDYLVDYLWYNGTYTQRDFRSNITINYTDGTSETFKYGYDEEYGEKNCVTLFGNKDYYINISSSSDVSGPYYGEFTVSIAGHDYIYEKYDNIVKTSVEINKEYLLNNLEYCYTRFTRNVKNITENLTNAKSFDEVIYCIERYVNSLNHIRDMVIEIYNFITFVI